MVDVKIPESCQIVLACWKDGTTPFDRLGAGRDTTFVGDDSGSLMLSLRLVERVDADNVRFGYYSLCDSVRSIALRLFISNKYGEQCAFMGHEISYAELSTMQRTVKLMEAWSRRAQRKYVGGEESLEQQIRRCLYGAGVTNAVLITRGGDSYKLASLNLVMRDYVKPAIESVRSRLTPKQEAA